MKQNKQEEKRIYEMHYDRDYNDDGSMRKNKYLGTFIVDKQVFDDCYSEEFVGKREEDGKTYCVKGREVSGIGGGTRYNISEIENVEEYLKYIELKDKYEK